MLRAKSLDDSGAKSWPLPKSGYLSSLIIDLKADNDSLGNRNNQIYEHLDKIEVLISGTKIIKSLKYCEPHALNAIDHGQMPKGLRREYASHPHWEQFLLNFGRKPKDLEYGLDLSKVTDPKFSLEWNLDLAADGTEDQFETDSLVLNIIAVMLREGPPSGHKGYIRSQEIDKWTGAQDVVHTVEIPIANEIRRIMLRSFLHQYEMYNGLWYTELDLNRGTRIPFKMYGKEWIFNDNVLNEYKGLVHTMSGLSSGKYTGGLIVPYSNFGKIEGGSWIPHTAARMAPYGVVSANTLATQLEDEAGVPQEDEWAHAIFAGIAPYSCLTIPFDKPNMDYMLKSTDYTDIDLKVTSHWEWMAAEVAQEIRCVIEEVIPQ